MADPVRFGVLSTSAFFRNRFLPGLRRASGVEVVAVASRELERARAFAEQTQIPVAYGSYEELLADPTVEVVYNPLPNHLHVPWTRRAAEAGKHVLCEKPMGLSAAEVETLLPLAERVHIAEAFMVRHHPQWIETRERVRRGELGRVTHMIVSFQYHNTDPANIRNIAAAGGGALADIGCYGVVAARWFLDAEVVHVAAMMDRDPAFGTDRLTSAVLDMGDGRTCLIAVSTQSVPHQRIHVFGTAGRLELTIPFNQPQTAPCVYFTHDGSSLDGLDATAHTVAACDQYAAQAEAFCHRVRHETPTADAVLDALANMAVLDAIVESARTQRFVPVARR